MGFLWVSFATQLFHFVSCCRVTHKSFNCLWTEKTLSSFKKKKEKESVVHFYFRTNKFDLVFILQVKPQTTWKDGKCKTKGEYCWSQRYLKWNAAATHLLPCRIRVSFSVMLWLLQKAPPRIWSASNHNKEKKKTFHEGQRLSSVWIFVSFHTER